MAALIELLVSLIVLSLGLAGLFMAATFGLVALFILGPLAIMFAILGALLWDPLLWLGLGVGIYLMYRVARRKGYIKISRK